MEPVSLLGASSIDRFGRQLLVPSFGAQSHFSLSTLSVLIVGAGGLGCPSGLYLASSGVKHIGIVDNDAVDEGNLHRQIAHTEQRVGLNKARSLCSTLLALNSRLQVTVHEERFSDGNADALVTGYDIVLDCTDNPGTRYLINDVCIIHGKPLVSGAAIGCDGQLSVYGWRGGPCYRCIHPVPPLQGMVNNCADAGVLGPVTGVIGSLQALEVMKIAASLARERMAAQGQHTPGEHVPTMGEPLAGSMLVFDGSEGRMRTVKLRGRRPDCLVCGASPSLTSASASHAWGVAHGLAQTDQEAGNKKGNPADTEQQAGEQKACPCDNTAAMNLPDLVPHISPGDLQARMLPHNNAQSSTEGERGHSMLSLLDVREPVQYSIAALKPSVNIPLVDLQRAVTTGSVAQTDAAAESNLDDGKRKQLQALLRSRLGLGPGQPLPSPLSVICRRGVDSVAATRLLNEVGIPAVNVTGGLRAWSRDVDPSMPWY